MLGLFGTQGELDIPNVKRACLSCNSCPLHLNRKTDLTGKGALAPRILVIGEAPLSKDNDGGGVFSQNAGRFLEVAFSKIDVSDVYYTNAVACPTHKSEAPSKESIDACRNFVFGHIRALNPRVIMLLGSSALKSLKVSNKPLLESRGKWYKWESFPVIATYHPAQFLRTIASPNGKLMQTAFLADLKAVKAKLEDVERMV